MLHDVVSATYRSDYLIEIEFDDGQRGTVDFAKYLKRQGVFERFRNLEFFQFGDEFGYRFMADVENRCVKAAAQGAWPCAAPWTRDRFVQDRAFNAASEKLGKTDGVELTGLVGYYSMKEVTNATNR